jgi:F-type H+-transporting ATPase subunit b
MGCAVHVPRTVTAPESGRNSLTNTNTNTRNLMLIDWFTVGAQVVNFLILVWLLKRFLYGPILAAIDAREQRIAKELAHAASEKAEAENERAEFRHKNVEFNEQRAALLTRASDEATAERQRLLDEAGKAADALSARRKETLAHEAKSLHQALRRRTQDEVFAIARQTLTDLASASLERRISEVFMQRVRGLEGEAKAKLAEALHPSSEPAMVRSALDLPADLRAAIQKTLNETFSADIPLQFETAPHLVGGIELTRHGQRVAWSIGDYLTSLDKGISHLLGPKDPSGSAPEPKHSQLQT